MNHSSLDERLRNATPPTPDPRARLAARRAALAEFESIHGQARHQPVRVGWWNSRSRLWGGLATACVAVVGVSIVWLMPGSERQIRTVVPTEPEVQLPGPAPELAPAPAPAPVTTPSGVVSTHSSETQQSEAGVVPPVVDVGGQVSTEAAAPGPVTGVSAGQLQALGMVNVADALTALVPQNLSTSIPATLGDDQAGAGGGMERLDRGSAFIGDTIANLRGLDPAFGSRTLTLVDGRRVASTSSQADLVDQNAIPGDLPRRADVLTAGTQAVPAAPAVAITAEEMRRLGIVSAADALALLQPQRLVPLPQPQSSPSGDRFGQFEINPPRRVADEPVSTFSIDVDTSSYSYVRRQLTNGVLPPAAAVRAEEMINYFDYGWPAAQSRREPFRPTLTVSDSPWGEGRKLIHIGIKGYELPARERPDVNLVLLMDVSGSMSSPDKLPLAQQSVTLLLDSLQPTDTVAIAVYAGAAGEVLPPTPVRERERILAALNGLRAGGSTAGAAGIQLAYQLARRGFREGGVNRILLATDGDFNVGISDPNQLTALVAREREQGVMLSVLGFGQGNYRDEMAQALAQNGNGVAAYIDTLGEARKVLVEEATSALFTIAKDVKLQMEFNPATVAEYRLIGYETRALNREDFNNDRIDAGDVGAGHTVTAIYEITPVGAPGRMLDELRYVRPATVQPRGRTGEYGFLKVRYKLPDEDESRLLELPIDVSAGVPRRLRNDVQFSTAVAGFAQLLQGGRYTGSLDYEDVIGAAQAAIGADTLGHRQEFVQLVRRAQQAAAR